MIWQGTVFTKQPRFIILSSSPLPYHIFPWLRVRVSLFSMDIQERHYYKFFLMEYSLQFLLNINLKEKWFIVDYALNFRGLCLDRAGTMKTRTVINISTHASKQVVHKLRCQICIIWIEHLNRKMENTTTGEKAVYKMYFIKLSSSTSTSLSSSPLSLLSS